MVENEISPAVLTAWRKGIEHFNRGSYWHAHESWEVGWVRLPSRRKRHLQSLIQLCGVFHLLAKGRGSGAASLCRSALIKWDETSAGRGLHPRISVPGVRRTLRLILERLENADCPVNEIAAGLCRKGDSGALRATLLLHRKREP